MARPPFKPTNQDRTRGLSCNNSRSSPRRRTTGRVERVMSEETLDSPLLRTEALVDQADRRVVKQRRLVARLEREGQDSLEARTLLAQLEERRNLHLAERDRLLKELGK